MKRNILHIVIALLFTGFASSCSDFLDRYPLDELSDKSFWKTEDDAMMAVTDGRVHPKGSMARALKIRYNNKEYSFNEAGVCQELK